MRTAMVMVNRFGEVICELEKTGEFFYGVSKRDEHFFGDLLMEGDEFRVEAIEVED